MGYDLHITRAEDWCENEGSWITHEEWRAAVDADPELRFSEENSVSFDGEESAERLVEWVAGGKTPGEPGGCLYWDEGNLCTKNPGEAFIRKLCSIADRLNATVQGDDGERYPEALEPQPAKGSHRVAVSLALSAVAVAVFALLVGIAATDHTPPGTPPPWGYAAAEAGLMLLTLGAWIAGVLLALTAWFEGQPGRGLAVAASAAGAGAIAVLFLLLE
ncbi:MAG: hypothetical protein JXR94_02635 [Candidatus Hydrogenedentes bacterium]|nr:hypothetical protein [Candidatus Hydrogenedentota bacterium]